MCVIIYVVHLFICTICVQLVFDYFLSDYGPVYIYTYGPMVKYSLPSPVVSRMITPIDRNRYDSIYCSDI